MGSNKRTIHNAIIIMLAMLVCLHPIMPVEASEPSDIKLVYVFDSNTLTVNVSHYVPNTKTHYIETIEIKNNALSIINRTYSNQTYNWGVYDSFTISTDVGDNLTVTATCSKGYPITSWLIVSSTTATNPITETTSTTTITDTTDATTDPDSPGTTANMGPVIVVVIALVIFIILFFAWFEPDRFPGGSRINAGLSWFWEKVRSGISWLGTGIRSFFQKIKDKVSSR